MCAAWTDQVDTAGRAGASARGEHQRRKAADERRIRERWGRLGGIAVALSDERQSTAAWERGAVGEERVGARLDRLEGVAVLHDRRIPGTRANIDHLAITTTSVWVVDAKRYRGRPTRVVEGGLLRPRTEKLVVARRDRTRLVDGVVRQVDLVRDALGVVPVTGALCFIEADWPVFGGAFAVQGVDVVWPRLLCKQLRAESGGQLDVAAVRDRLAHAFPPA